MGFNWDAQVQRAGGDYQAADFQQAAYQLVTDQVLYESNGTQRSAYRLIASYETAFRDFALLMGLQLETNHTYRYAAVYPISIRTATLTLKESLFVISLRQVYDERMSSGEEEGGRPVVTLDEIETACKTRFHRELVATRPEWRDLIDRVKRFGIARDVPADELSEQPFDVEILPAIEVLISPTTLSRIGAEFQAIAAMGAQAPEEEDEEA